MEGIETTGQQNFRNFALSISRCPDMEGIETINMQYGSFIGYIPVGAPTWRGLKLEELTRRWFPQSFQ